MTTRAIAKHWLNAFNKHDLESLLSLYGENAVHFSPKLLVLQPETNGVISGKNAMRNWWKEAFFRLPSLQYIEQSITFNKNRVIIEYARKVAGEKDLPVAEVFEIQNGFINSSRVYHG